MDAIAHRHMNEYIRSLPHGLASYPECTTKTSLALSALENHDPRVLAVGAPEELAQLILDPPPHGVWMPAAHTDAIIHLVCDHFYPTVESMMAWCLRRTMAIGDHPLYRTMLRVSGPRIFFSMAVRTHGLFQRGTNLELLENSGGRVVAVLSFPPKLHNRFNLLSNVQIFVAVATLTGGKDVECQMLEYNDTSALYECSWA